MRVKTKGLTLNVVPDDYPPDPREDGYNVFGHWLCWHRRYSLGDFNPYKTSQDFWDDKDLQEKIFVMRKVYMLDHSALYFSTTPFTAIDPQDWDSGVIGIIYATKADVLAEYGNLSETTKAEVLQRLADEINEYNEIQQRQYYEFFIENGEGKIVNSCCGFYGDSMEEVLESMKDATDTQYEPLFDKAINRQSESEM